MCSFELGPLGRPSNRSRAKLGYNPVLRRICDLDKSGINVLPSYKEWLAMRARGELSGSKVLVTSKKKGPGQGPRDDDETSLLGGDNSLANPANFSDEKQMKKQIRKQRRAEAKGTTDQHFSISTDVR